MRVMAIIPVHAPPKVAELTIGTLLRNKGNYELDIHVGVHSNYHHYSKDLSLFENLRGIAQIHAVDEIDWVEYNACVYRYSVMHCRNLENLMKAVRHYAFDYLLILDQDLYIKADLVSKCLERHPDADMIGAVFDDVWGLRPFETERGQKLLALPKVSVWHLLLSRSLFDRIIEMPSLIYPRIEDTHDRWDYLTNYGVSEKQPIFVDTFADVLYYARHRWNVRLGSISTEEFSSWVHHYFASSFNYGYRCLKDAYGSRMTEIEETFEREFPEGLAPFRQQPLTSPA